MKTQKLKNMSIEELLERNEFSTTNIWCCEDKCVEGMLAPNY